MYFKNDAQRKAVMANLFSRESRFSVSDLSTRQIKGCNKFSDDDSDYSEEEMAKISELRSVGGNFRDIRPASGLTLQEMQIEMAYPKASADEIGAIQSAAKESKEIMDIKEKGLSALESAPDYLYNPEIKKTLSGYLGEYASEQAIKDKLEAARTRLMPVYDYRMDLYKRQADEAAMAKERSAERQLRFDEPALRQAQATAESMEYVNKTLGSMTDEERKNYVLNRYKPRERGQSTLYGSYGTIDV